MSPEPAVAESKWAAGRSSSRSHLRRGASGGIRRGARIISTVLVTAGLVIAADAGLTLIWQEPVSAAYGWLGQQQVADDVDELEAQFRQRFDGVQGFDRSRIPQWASALRRRVEPREGIGRIEIPEIDADFTMVHGTDTSSLRKGPGHYPETALPGEGGTVGIAGHRTTYLAPFRRINELERRDPVIVEMPYARLTYRVEKTRIVEPTQVGVVRKVDHERVVLTACHPLYSADKRIVIFARLVAEGAPPGLLGRSRVGFGAPSDADDMWQGGSINDA
jgi:sortase A